MPSSSRRRTPGAATALPASLAVVAAGLLAVGLEPVGPPPHPRHDAPVSMHAPAPARVEPAGPAAGVEVSIRTRAGVRGTGPVLVVTDAANRFTDDVCDTLLPTEGYTGCAAVDAGALNRSVRLAPYRVVLLGDRVTLRPRQVDRLTGWVERGGTLIALHPRDDLAPMLGLTSRTAVQDGGYLAPARGGSLQLHGEADVRAVAGARTVARLLTTPSSTSDAPAVSEHRVGRGTASAWAFDPARSVLLTRNGSPELTGRRTVSVDGRIRMADRFGEGFLDPNRLTTPQADEVLHLLGQQLAAAGLPRLWYLPNAPDGSLRRAAVVLTGDDHDTDSRTSSRFRQLAADSPPGCSVADWTCLRATAYTFPGSITAARAADWTRQGFELGPHVADGTSCTAPGAAAQDFLAAWRAGNPAPTTTRWHCYGLWTTYAGVADADRAAGLAADTSTACWPEQAFGAAPCYLAGTALPMPYADTDGRLTGVLQFPTQVTDENPALITRPAVDALLGSVTGYATVLAHLDGGPESALAYRTVRGSARALGLPLVSTRQATAFWTARTATGLSLAGDRIRLDGAPPRLTLLVPATSRGRALVGLSVDGQDAVRRITTLEGTRYAVVTDAHGEVRARYR